MSVVTIPAAATTGTVADAANAPITGKTGRKVTAGDSYDQYTIASTLERTYYFTLYLELDSFPSALARVLHIVDTGGGVVCSLRVSTSGVLQLFDTEGSQQGSTINLGLGKPYLIDLSVKQKGAGNGVVTLRVDKEVIDNALSVKLTNTAWNRLRVGINTTSATATSGIFTYIVGINDSVGAENNSFIPSAVYPSAPAGLAPSGHGRRPVIPVGLGQVNNVQLAQNSDRLALRFVPDTTGTLYRFLMGFNMEGVDTNSAGAAAPSEIRNPGGTGRSGYGNGNGGTIKVQLVECNEDGTPDLTAVLAQETFNAVDRYEAAKALFAGLDPTKPNQFIYVTFDVQVTKGQLYAVVVQNTHASPAANFVSVNCPTTSPEAAGPHNANTLDEFAPGAMAGLDPREAVAWSIDSGGHWFWGARAGGDTEAQGIEPPREGGHKSGYYSGFSELDLDEKVRLPWYGFLSADGVATAVQPYYNYLKTIATPVLRARNAGRAETVTEAGGYALEGDEVGTVTVENITTGDSASTDPLGSGLVSGELSKPIVVNAGDTLWISATGTVALEQADSFQRAIFNLGGGDWPFTTDNAKSDRAALFALPWPYFAAPADSTPEPDHLTGLGDLLYDALAPLDA